MADNTTEHPFSADRPITSRAADLLGRSVFSGSLASAIKGWRGLDSLVIALYGPWGSGKSSIKNMMIEALREAEEGCPSIVEFNPWQWLGPEQLAEAFFREVGVALGKADDSKEGKQRADKWRFYGRCLTLGVSIPKLLKTGFSMAGYPEANIALEPLITGMEESARVAQEGSDALTAQAESRERNLSEIKQDLADALKTLENPILVVMDDIDRLATGEIRLLFQLVKANADFPNLIYLLLFPRIRVEQSLGDPTTSDGREFLEKIVQVGFDIPLIERPLLEKVLIDGLNNLLTEENVTRHVDEQRWGNLFIPGLRPYFETLRDVRRFLATLAFQVSLFRSGGGFEVNPIDLIALEVLRVFEPDVYQQFPTVKDMLTNFRNSGSQSSRAEEEGRRMAEDIVNHASEANRPRVQEILKQLFPRIEWVFGGSHYGAGVDEQWFRELRVCHPKVFDRYFHLTIPAGDIARAELDRILSLVGDREGLVTEFRALNQRGLLGTALDRLEAYKENIDLQHAVPFITALFDIGDELPDEPGGLYSMAADMHALRIIHWYLMRESASGKRGRIIKDAMNATQGLYLPVRKTDLENAKHHKEPKASSITEANLRDLKTICVKKIRTAAKEGTLASHPKMLSFLYRWREWTSSKEPKRWVRGLMRSREGLLAFLVALLQRSQVWGLTDHVSRDEWSIRLENVEDFVPADAIARKITQLPPRELTEQQQRAIHAFQQALQQSQEGRTGGTDT